VLQTGVSVLHEQTTLVIDRGELSITAGSWGTAPLYLVERDGPCCTATGTSRSSIHSSAAIRSTRSAFAHFLIAFSRELLAPHALLRRPAIDRAQRRRAMAGGRPADRVSERGSVAAPAQTQAPIADVAGAMQELITESMRRWIDGATWTFGAELSSGLDSGHGRRGRVVAARHAAPHVRPGSCRVSKAKVSARAATRVIAKFGYIDTAFAADENLPLTPRLSRRAVGGDLLRSDRTADPSRRVGMASPCCSTDWAATSFARSTYDELEEDQQQELVAPEVAPSFLSPRVHDAYRDTILTLDRAPCRSDPELRVRGFAAGAALYLRNGIWPVAPMSTPELVELCRMLPIEWRENRECHRQLMLRSALAQRRPIRAPPSRSPRCSIGP